CRAAAGDPTHRVGASLSDAASENHRWSGGGPRVRHSRASGRPIPVGKAWPTILRRSPAGCCWQYRNRGREPHAARRLHAAPGELAECHQRCCAPVGKVESVPLVMEVHPSVPAKTVPEFIAYAKANPRQLDMASAGIGGPQSWRQAAIAKLMPRLRT